MRLTGQCGTCSSTNIGKGQREKRGKIVDYYWCASCSAANNRKRYALRERKPAKRSILEMFLEEGGRICKHCNLFKTKEYYWVSPMRGIPASKCKACTSEIMHLRHQRNYVSTRRVVYLKDKDDERYCVTCKVYHNKTEFYTKTYRYKGEKRKILERVCKASKANYHKKHNYARALKGKRKIKDMERFKKLHEIRSIRRSLPASKNICTRCAEIKTKKSFNKNTPNWCITCLKEYHRDSEKTARDELGSNYIKQMIIQQMKAEYTASEIPIEAIETKRAMVAFKRELKQWKEVINEK